MADRGRRPGRPAGELSAVLQGIVRHGLRLSLLLIVFVGIGGTIWYGYDLQSRGAGEDAAPVIKAAPGPTRVPFAKSEDSLRAVPSAGPSKLEVEPPPTLTKPTDPPAAPAEKPSASSATPIEMPAATTDAEVQSPGKSPAEIHGIAPAAVTPPPRERSDAIPPVPPAPTPASPAAEVTKKISELVEEAGAKSPVESAPALQSTAAPETKALPPQTADLASPSSPVEPAPPASGAGPALALLSVVNSNGGRIAVVQRLETRELISLLPGQEIDGWRVHDIQPERLSLDRAGETKEFTLGEGVAATEFRLSAAIGSIRQGVEDHDRSPPSPPPPIVEAPTVMERIPDRAASVERPDGSVVAVAGPDAPATQPGAMPADETTMSPKDTAPAPPSAEPKTVAVSPATQPSAMPADETAMPPKDTAPAPPSVEPKTVAASPTVPQNLAVLRTVAPAAGPPDADRATEADPARAAEAAEVDPAAVPAAKDLPPTSPDASRETPVTVVASVPPGGYRVQLAALKSSAGAEREWVRLRTVHRDLFGDLEHWVERADLGTRGIFFRLQSGPLADGASANALCDRAKSRQLGCLVVKP